MKVKKIDIPIFKGSLILIKDKNFKKVNKKYDLNISENYGAVSFRKSEKSYVLFFGNHKAGKIKYVHELQNVMQSVFQHLN